MTERHDPEKELHGIKTHLMELKEDLGHVIHDTAATVRHSGHWNKETAKEMVDDVDNRLGRAITGAEAKAAVAHPDDARGYEQTAAGLTALRSDLNTEYEAIGDGTADDKTIKAIEEFHDRVDEHLEYLRKSGREW